MAKSLTVSNATHKWLNSLRKTIKGKYTPAKKESFDTVLERIRVQGIEPEKKE
jgi:hypothetical protein